MAVKIILGLGQSWWNIEAPSQASVISVFEGLVWLTGCRLYSTSFVGQDGFKQGQAELPPR